MALAHRHGTAPYIIVALDHSRPDDALALAGRLDPRACRLKVGKELFTRAGPELVRRLVADGHSVFLDLKYHDIPNTVAGAVAAAAGLGVWMVNVHALGGARMLAAAAEALSRAGTGTLLTAVTVLTSMATEDLQATGIILEPEDLVLRLARLARDQGCHGVVASAAECPALRGALGDDFVIVTPGIRPAGAPADDQRRVVTPAAALAAGASWLVVGRPITGAPDPARALEDLRRGIGERP